MRLPDDFSPEERGQKARDLFLQGYNCCQAVLLAFSDVLADNGLADAGTLATIGSGFGGGMARMREVCGSFSGAVMMAGFISPASDTDRAKRAANYSLVQEMAERFKAANSGSIVCGELLGLRKRDRVPAAGTEQVSGAKRPCPEIIRNAAVIVAEKMLDSSR